MQPAQPINTEILADLFSSDAYRQRLCLANQRSDLPEKTRPATRITTPDIPRSERLHPGLRAHQNN